MSTPYASLFYSPAACLSARSAPAPASTAGLFGRTRPSLSRCSLRLCPPPAASARVPSAPHCTTCPSWPPAWASTSVLAWRTAGVYTGGCWIECRGPPLGESTGAGGWHSPAGHVRGDSVSASLCACLHVSPINFRHPRPLRFGTPRSQDKRSIATLIPLLRRRSPVLVHASHSLQARRYSLRLLEGLTLSLNNGSNFGLNHIGLVLLLPRDHIDELPRSLLIRLILAEFNSNAGAGQRLSRPL